MTVSSKEFESYRQMYLTFNNFQIQYKIKKSKKNYENLFFWVGLISCVIVFLATFIYDCLRIRGI